MILARSRLLQPLIEVAAVAAIVLAARAYRQVRNWGAEPTDRVRVLPGDELLPEARFIRNRAVIIEADREVIWRWLMRSGRPLGGWLRGRWMGQFDGFALAVVVAEAPSALVLRQRAPALWDVTWAFVIIPAPAGHWRLLVRTRAGHGSGWVGRLQLFVFRLLDPVTVMLTRRMLLDIKFHAEAARLKRSAA